MAEEGFEFYGTRYAAKTVASRTAGGLWRNALSRGSLDLAGVVALGQNLWQYGTVPSQGATFWDRTVKNREFWVSTAVDFAVSVAVGVAAAAVVGGTLVLFGLTPPLAVVIVATTFVAIGLGWLVERAGLSVYLKKSGNKFLGEGKNEQQSR